MSASNTFRSGAWTTLVAISLIAGTVGGVGMAQAPVMRPEAPAPRPVPMPRPAPPTSSRDHLPQWMDNHRNLTPQQQQQALQNETGFRQLPPETQQRMLNRLQQLNAMNQQQRTHVLERAEQMENLNPQQRQQIRGAMSELGRLPVDRRKVVARAFRDLRGMPENQRQSYLNSDYLHRQLSPEERITLGNLMAVEPLLPAQSRGVGPQ